MRISNYRCLLFDLDGTLLRSDKTMSARTRRALDTCRDRGLLIGICTNRGESRARGCLESIRPDVVIASGGALVRCKGEIVLQAELSPEETVHVLGVIRQVCGPDPEITMDTMAAHYQNFKYDPTVTDESWSDSVYCDFDHYKGPALKISTEITDETFRALTAALPACDCLRHSEVDWCKITKKNVTKEAALKAVCRALGLGQEEIVAFGDDTPDIEILRLCGLGVAMGNAIPVVKAAADEVIGTNDEDGIAAWVEAAFHEGTV